MTVCCLFQGLNSTVLVNFEFPGQFSHWVIACKLRRERKAICSWFFHFHSYNFLLYGCHEGQARSVPLLMDKNRLVKELVLFPFDSLPTSSDFMTWCMYVFIRSLWLFTLYLTFGIWTVMQRRWIHKPTWQPPQPFDPWDKFHIYMQSLSSVKPWTSSPSSRNRTYRHVLGSMVFRGVHFLTCWLSRFICKWWMHETRWRLKPSLIFSMNFVACQKNHKRSFPRDYEN